MPIMKTQSWEFKAALPEERECGSCYACCVHLGIAELRKYAGQTCKHLDGAKPEARCSIYAKRPAACANYYCLWRAGVGPKNFSPLETGMLMSHFVEEDGRLSATITIIDAAKAEGLVMTAVTELLMTNVFKEVAVVRRDTNKAVLFKDGHMYDCKLLPPRTGNYEETNFLTDGEPVCDFLVTTEAELKARREAGEVSQWTKAD